MSQREFKDCSCGIWAFICSCQSRASTYCQEQTLALLNHPGYHLDCKINIYSKWT